MSDYSEHFSKTFDLSEGYSRIEFEKPILAYKGFVPVIEYISDGKLYLKKKMLWFQISKLQKIINW